MSKETPVVGCRGIDFHNGVVRIDFTSFSATGKVAKGFPLKEMRHRVIITPIALLETFNAMQSIVSKLLGKGILQRMGNPEAGTDALLKYPS